ncbi:MAG TPA: YcxB family protein [Pyrinomonadaceae bacterium]|nr:YcxB family protein [Pyrinomonadaceae bacterium]
MEIIYHLEPRDVVAFQRYAYRTSPATRKMRLYLYIFFAAIAAYNFLTSSAYSLATRIVSLFVDLAIFYLIFLFWTVVVGEYLFRRSVPQGQNNGVTGWHKLTLGEREIVEQTNVNEGHHLWEGVDRVEQDASYIYLFITNNQAHIIPKRAFENERHAEDFYARASALKARAGGVIPQPVPTETPQLAHAAPVSYLDEQNMTPIERVFRRD